MFYHPDTSCVWFLPVAYLWCPPQGWSGLLVMGTLTLSHSHSCLRGASGPVSSCLPPIHYCLRTQDVQETHRYYTTHLCQLSITPLHKKMAKRKVDFESRGFQGRWDVKGNAVCVLCSDSVAERTQHKKTLWNKPRQIQAYKHTRYSIQDTSIWTWNKSSRR